VTQAALQVDAQSMERVLRMDMRRRGSNTKPSIGE